MNSILYTFLAVSIFSLFLIIGNAVYSEKAAVFSFSSDKAVIEAENKAKLSWNVQTNDPCESSVDVQNEKGAWVWDFSNIWQSSARPANGTFDVSPKRSSRYYLSCLQGGKKIQKKVEIVVSAEKQDTTKEDSKERDQPADQTKQSAQTSVPVPTEIPQAASPGSASSYSSTSQPSTQESYKPKDQGNSLQPSTGTKIQTKDESNNTPIKKDDEGSVNKIPKKNDVREIQRNGQIKSKTRIPQSSAEKRARALFTKIYRRVANVRAANDSAALHIIQFGLPRNKSVSRKIGSERAPIATFISVYKRKPTSAEDWRIIAAIAYSGAKREKDADNDLLSDKDELMLGTDRTKKDTDGDGYPDGMEVDNNYSPLERAPRVE